MRGGASFACAAVVLFGAVFIVSTWGFLSRNTWQTDSKLVNAELGCAPNDAVPILTDRGAIVPLAFWNGLTADALEARWKRLQAFFAARHTARSIANSDTESEDPRLPAVFCALRENKMAVGYAVNLADRTLLVPAMFTEFRPGRSIACLDRGTSTLSYPPGR